MLAKYKFSDACADMHTYMFLLHSLHVMAEFVLTGQLIRSEGVMVTTGYDRKGRREKDEREGGERER